MSSQNAGRQSPDPERQGHAQVGDVSNAKSQENPSKKNQEQSDEQKESTLSSNPTGPLEASAAAKITKPGEKSLDGL